jgi:glutathione synthase/RimK-type ligase-like ATP-grasp enzyme
MGAYYTKEDITEYISKNCIIPYLFDRVKQELYGIDIIQYLVIEIAKYKGIKNHINQVEEKQF